jgi:hypothetical protein
MSILRQINFADTRVVIEQAAEPLHYIETSVRDFLRAQPLQNLPALKRNWQLPDLLN